MVRDHIIAVAIEVEAEVEVVVFVDHDLGLLIAKVLAAEPSPEMILPMQTVIHRVRDIADGVKKWAELGLIALVEVEQEVEAEVEVEAEAAQDHGLPHLSIRVLDVAVPRIRIEIKLNPKRRAKNGSTIKSPSNMFRYRILPNHLPPSLMDLFQVPAKIKCLIQR